MGTSNSLSFSLSLSSLTATVVSLLGMCLLWHPRAGGEDGSWLIARGGYHGHGRLCGVLAELPVQARLVDVNDFHERVLKHTILVQVGHLDLSGWVVAGLRGHICVVISALRL